MKALYFECFSGISGNMTLGALLDLGIVSQEYLLSELAKLKVDGYKIEIKKDQKNAIGATHVDVILEHPEHPDVPHHHEHHEDRELTHEEMHKLNLPHDGDKHYHLSDLTHEQIHELGLPHHHEHHEDRELTHEEMHILNLPHDGDKHYHLSDLTHEQIHQLGVPHGHHHDQRNLYMIEKIIDDSEISEGAKALAKKIFMRVALAESKVHQETLENVHFHEVGAVDSIVDIIGTAILIDAIKPDVIYSSVVHDGYGFIHCAHGMIPVPVPATSEILAARGATLKQIDIDTELVTPTGAAIISELATSFGLMPEMKIEKLGWGSGTKNLKIPNILRVCYGEVARK